MSTQLKFSKIKFSKNIKILFGIVGLSFWTGPVNLQAGETVATAPSIPDISTQATPVLSGKGKLPKTADVKSATDSAQINTGSANNDITEHGWAMLDSVRSFMVYPVTFYSLPRGLMSRLHDGMVVRVKSLKTGFGSYYKLEKSSNGAWAFKADTKDPKDPASQFLVSQVSSGSGKYITLTSETAGGLLLASDPKTLDVTLVGEQNTGGAKAVNAGDAKTGVDATGGDDSTLWELVEDSNAGDTLDTCYLRNKATKGLLTATYDVSGDSDAQMADLKSKIDPLEKATPYLTITSASIEGGGKSMVDEINKRIPSYVLDAIGQKIDVDGVGGVFEISGNNWAESMCGVSHKSWQIKTGKLIHSRPRNVVIKYMEGTDKTEKILNTNESATVKLVADVTKHPAWPLRQKLNDLIKKSQEMGVLKNSDVGRTGFNGMSFGTDLASSDVQWSKVAIEPVVDVGEDESADKDSIVLPAAQEGGFVKTDLDDIWVHKNPEFEGSFQSTLSFGPGQVITVNPLSSKGFVWLSQKFQTPGYGAVTFRALTQGSDIQICFSDAVAPRTVYRIVFGASANTKTVIYKNEIPVQQIDNDQSKWASVSPGTIASFWVNLHDGFIIVGKGDPGTRIIMAWRDPNPAANITQIGFSTYKSEVKYTDVQIIDNPLVVLAPTKSYIIDSNPIQAGTVAAPAWHRLPLSPPDAGTIVFQATGNEEATLILENDKNEGYAISFGSDGNTTSKIVALEDKPENQQELCKIDAKSTPLAALDVGKPNKFWVNFYKGLIILGKGDVGKNTFCIYADNDAPDGIYKIGFAGKATLQNLEIWPQVGLGFDQDVTQYLKQHQNPPAQGMLSIISPFDYEIYQRGPIIVFKDLITGMTTNIAGTPDPGLIYHFTLDIGADGSPNLIAGANSQAPAKIAMGASVKALEVAKDVVLTAQMTVAMEAGNLPDDPLKIDVAIAAVMLIAAAAMGGAGSALAATQAGVQSKIDEMNKLGSRKINNEKIIRMVGGSSAVSDEAKDNRAAFDASMKAIFGPLPDDPNNPKSIAKRDEAGKLDYITGLWVDALGLITDAYVVGDPETKKSVISGLSDLYNRVINLGFNDDTSALYNRMMNILIKAYNSPYLTSFGNPADDKNRDNWYLWINNLANQYFSSQKLMSQGVVVDFKGEYLWFPIPFTQAGSGSITFEVQASGDVFVCFSENNNLTSEMLKRIYEIDFGAWENSKTVIHRTPLGDSVVEFDQEKITGLSLDPMIFKKYWINIDNGVFSGGVGDLGQNKLWEWTDPYTPVPVKWIGFSNWLSAITIRNVVVGNAIGK